MSRIIRFVAIATGGLILACGCLFLFTSMGGEDAETVTTTPVPTRIVSIKKGDITVPGTAYLDGRDPDAQPPLTIMKINVWETYSTSSSVLVCDLPHGQKVDVLDVAELDGRFWFQIDDGNGCIGWLLDSLIGAELTEPIGDSFP